MESPDRLIERVEAALGNDDELAAIAAFERLSGPHALSDTQARKLMRLARGIDRNDLALAALAKGPASRDQQLIALQLRMETGEAVADAVRRLLVAGRSEDPVLLQLAGALDMEGRGTEACALLGEALGREPGWIAGHQTVAQLRWQSGDGEATASFAAAVERRPDDEMLWAAWLGTLKSAADWPGFLRVASAARARFPASMLLRMVRADALSDMGRLNEADGEFAALSAIADPDFDAARIRHAMRNHRYDEAARLAAVAVNTHGAGECWAWLGAAWRLTGDPRSSWFHRGGDLIGTFDVDLSAAQLDALATLLRSLHRGSAPPLGQSPRGGTQTQGPLLKRLEPEIRALRQQLRPVVRRYIDALPAPDPRHPVLGRKRRAFGFEGAWSILLRPAGRHVAHIHSHGWISSAFYVDLPPGLDQAVDKKGWLDIGVPPLPAPAPVTPLASIAPRRGRLALFPSIFWHGTRPFDAGERLTAAFDIVPR